MVGEEQSVTAREGDDFPQIPDPSEQDSTGKNENEQTWKTLQTALGSMDPYYHAPQWMVIGGKKTRKERREEKQRELEIMNFIDLVFNRMIQDGLGNLYKEGTQNHPGINTELRTGAKEIILLADRMRRLKGEKKLSWEEILMVTYEIWHADYLHRNHTRNTGKLYARTHLFRACCKSIKNGGLTNLEDIITEIRHDDAEDLKAVHDPEAATADALEKSLDQLEAMAQEIRSALLRKKPEKKRAAMERARQAFEKADKTKNSEEAMAGLIKTAKGIEEAMEKIDEQIKGLQAIVGGKIEREEPITRTEGEEMKEIEEINELIGRVFEKAERILDGEETEDTEELSMPALSKKDLHQSEMGPKIEREILAAIKRLLVAIEAYEKVEQAMKAVKVVLSEGEITLGEANDWERAKQPHVAAQRKEAILGQLVKLRHAVEESRPIISVLKPDRPRLNEDELLAEEHYQWPLIEGQPHEEEARPLNVQEIEQVIDKLRRRVRQGMVGLTNIADTGPTKEEDNFRNLLEAILKHGIWVVALKAAGDRSDNLEDIRTNPKPKRRREIAHETARIFAPLMRIAQMETVYDYLMMLAFQYANPKAIRRFKQAQEEKLTACLGASKLESRLRQKLEALKKEVPEIKRIIIVPKRFSQYTNPNRIGETDYTPALDPDDPLFEIEIEIEDKSESDASQKENHIKEIRERVIAHLGGPIKLREIIDSSYSDEAGARFGLWNRELFEGNVVGKVPYNPIYITIMAQKDRYQNRQGWLRHSRERNPDYVDEAIREVLRRTEKGARALIFDELDRRLELSKGEILIKTPEGEPIRLHEGATPIDFAARIHGDVLKRAKGFIFRRTRGAPPLQISATTPLNKKDHDGGIIQVIEDENDPRIHVINKPELRWLCFAGSHGKALLRRYFKGGDDETRTQGEAYLQYLSRLLNIRLQDERLLEIVLILAEKDHSLRELIKLEAKKHYLEEGLRRIQSKEGVSKEGEEEDKRTALERTERTIEEKKQDVERAKAKLLSEIGRGNINPIELLGKDTITIRGKSCPFIGPDGVFVEVVLPNVPMASEIVTREFGRYGVNVLGLGIKRPKTMPPSRGGRARISLRESDERGTCWYRIVPHEESDATLYNVLQSILAVEAALRLEYPEFFARNPMPIKVKSAKFDQILDKLKSALSSRAK